MAVSETKIVYTGVATTNATETIIGGSNTIDYNAAFAGQGLIVRGTCNITTGASTTAVVIRVRKGNSLAGAVVGVALTHTLAAGATAQIYYEVLDTAPVTAPPDPAGAQGVGTNMYSLTVQQTAGSAPGTVNYATIGMESAARGV